jgi:TetR/AcrR family transcriptional regulator
MTATPTRMSATDRRNQLIDVAIDLFSRKGFAGTTTKEIAAAAGVTEAIIFRHFATKQDLYKAILDARCETPDSQAWFSEAQQFMDANDDEGLFRALITTIVQSKRDDPRFERLMLHAALEGNELAIMHHNQCALPVGKKLIAYIQKRQQEGAIRQLDPVAVIFSIVGMADFYAHQKYLHLSTSFPTSDEAVIDAFLAIVMKGLK